MRHGLVCLLHEKPFKGINGSGKHNNWSMSTDEGENLLDPGHTPHENEQFLTFLVSVTAAVDRYAELLRIGVSGASNDHRLGANEAPPAIMSVFLGEQLQDIFNQLEKGSTHRSKHGGILELGVTTLPPLPKDSTDRNRTSPFAFTGNKFEFRAVGSSQPCYLANTFLNVAVAEVLSEVADQLEKGKASLHRTLGSVLQKMVKEHKRVVFNGNNYAKEWYAEAAKRKLPNLTNTVDALKAMDNTDYKKMLAKHRVLSHREYDSREEIMWERYVKIVNIEANAMVDIARSQILPAVIASQGQVAGAVQVTREVAESAQAGQEALLEKLTKGASELYLSVGALEDLIDKANAESSLHKVAQGLKDKVLPGMEKVRSIADELEGLVDDEKWPLPKYREMLFQY
jgi:glutamine synthetase